MHGRLDLTWRERHLDDGADGAVAPDDVDLVEDLREQLVDQLHEAERAVDLPQLGGRDVGLQLVALASLRHVAPAGGCSRSILIKAAAVFAVDTIELSSARIYRQAGRAWAEWQWQY